MLVKAMDRLLTHDLRTHPGSPSGPITFQEFTLMKTNFASTTKMYGTASLRDGATCLVGSLFICWKWMYRALNSVDSNALLPEIATYFSVSPIFVFRPCHSHLASICLNSASGLFWSSLLAFQIVLWRSYLLYSYILSIFLSTLWCYLSWPQHFPTKCHTETTAILIKKNTNIFLSSVMLARG